MVNSTRVQVDPAERDTTVRISTCLLLYIYVRELEGGAQDDGDDEFGFRVVSNTSHVIHYALFLIRIFYCQHIDLDA